MTRWQTLPTINSKHPGGECLDAISDCGTPDRMVQVELVLGSWQLGIDDRAA
jgi:hypothetical protein